MNLICLVFTALGILAVLTLLFYFVASQSSS
jgi:hypothetical protein